MAEWNNIFSSLREFSSIVRTKDAEFKKLGINPVDFKADTLSWIIESQLILNLYVKEFKEIFFFRIRTAIEEQELSEMQNSYIKLITSKIPPKITQNEKDLFSFKILEIFAIHNRMLSEFWNETKILYQTSNTMNATVHRVQA